MGYICNRNMGKSHVAIKYRLNKDYRQLEVFECIFWYIIYNSNIMGRYGGVAQRESVGL